MNEHLVFYISHYCSDKKVETLLQYCLRGISEQYPNADIVICVSPSSYSPTHPIEYPRNASIIENPILNSGSVGCFKDFLSRYKDRQNIKAVFLHDTMILKDNFDKAILSQSFGFIWYFYDTNIANSIQHPNLRERYFKLFIEHNLENEGIGCFGLSCYGTYDAVKKLWDAIPFEKYMELGSRRLVMMDLERFIGITALYLGLISDIDTCSLCGNIFDFPYAFQEWYNNQSYEELCGIKYDQAVVKITSRRSYDA